MVYNEAAKELKKTCPNCEVSAIWGHIIDREGEDDIGRHISESGVCNNFDLIAMCVSTPTLTSYARFCRMLIITQLAIDFFATQDDPATLRTALEALVNRLTEDGSLLIIDIEKHYVPDTGESSGDALNPNLHSGKKKQGYGSQEVIAALQNLGLKEIAMKKDLHFEFEFNLLGHPLVREEWYFIVKAVKADKLKCSGNFNNSRWKSVDWGETFRT